MFQKACNYHNNVVYCEEFDSAINFLKISTSDTVANFRIDDFEVGQVADRTIVASKSLSADATDPVSITEGEKIMRYRIETDSIGELKIPAEAYYGINTARSANNFAITKRGINRQMIKSLTIVKKAAAKANLDADEITEENSIN